MAPLEALAAWPFAVAEFAAPPWPLAAAALAGAALLLAPRGLPLRLAGLALLAPLAAYRAPGPPPGEAWIDVLDVGQGLAVVVRTASHALAYDAGPSWNAEADSGSRIVVPYLRGEGVRRLDALVVTHADDDHAGGAASVAKSRSPRWLLVSLPPDDGRRRLAPACLDCLAGTRWEWDGVDFEVLHPDAAALRDLRRENDRSCVIRIAAGGGTALLAADIERQAEAELLARSRERLRADALLVPHHGSRSSSTPAFVAAVSPSVALVSVGWRNRFGQPSPVVLARYRDRGAAILRTDLSGAVRVRLPASPEEEVAAGRLGGRARYWSDRRPEPE
jgi:competence protein ComEC